MALEKSPKDKSPVQAAQNQAAEKGATESLLDKHVPSLTRFKLPKFFAAGEELVAEEVAETSESAFEESVTVAAETAPIRAVSSAVAPGEVGSEIAELRGEIERLVEQVTYVNERESSLERVFDALHSELADYKNDFLYEHLKPVVRPLLFLFDSLEQFESEVSMAEATMMATAQGGILSPHSVRENIHYFRDQLIEALRVCEVTIMDTPTGAFNPKFHKAIDVMPVPSEQDGTVVRAVRSGWFLNGQLLRPAEVVVGKFRPSS